MTDLSQIKAAIDRAMQTGHIDFDAETEAKIKVGQALGHEIIDLLLSKNYRTMPQDQVLTLLAALVGTLLRYSINNRAQRMLFAIKLYETLLSTAFKEVKKP